MYIFGILLQDCLDALKDKNGKLKGWKLNSFCTFATVFWVTVIVIALS